MADDLPDADVILTATDLTYCPVHGEELETDGLPVRCPTCGPVNIDYWRTPWEDDDGGAGQ